MITYRFYSLIGLLAVFNLISCHKDLTPEGILHKSIDQCQNVQNGTYEMAYYIKYISGKDTMHSTYKHIFKKLKDDSIFSSAFHYQKFSNNDYENDVLYTGNELVKYTIKDSMGEIISKKLWYDNLKSISHNFKFIARLTI
ncbi:MAG TPA: hypothetical protein ENK64_01845 [Flavobacteriales bacterium]|nr:hypothetical protein [Flavobacteriales bacterium]